MPSYVNPQTMQVYRNKFQTTYGVMLTDDEIADFNNRLKKAIAPGIPCVAIGGVCFILGLLSVITETNFLGEAEIAMFVVGLVVLCAGAGVTSTAQRKLEANFAEEVKRKRPASQAPAAVPGAFMGSTAPYGQQPPMPYGQQPTYGQLPQPSQVFVKETVIVKIRCQWCGKLVDQGLSECPNCLGRM